MDLDSKRTYFSHKTSSTSIYWFLETMKFDVCVCVCERYYLHIASMDAMKYVMWLILVVRKLYSEPIHLIRSEEFCNFTPTKEHIFVSTYSTWFERRNVGDPIICSNERNESNQNFAFSKIHVKFLCKLNTLNHIQSYFIHCVPVPNARIHSTLWFFPFEFEDLHFTFVRTDF